MSSKTRRARSARSAPPSAVALPRPDAASPPASAAGRPRRLWLAGGLAVVLLAVVGLGFFGQGLLQIGQKPVPATYSPEGRISFVRQNVEGKRDLFVVNPD